MKKQFLSIAMAVCMLTAVACGKKDAAPNTAPVISGVADQTVRAGSTFDAMAGVKATDTEDGDLTLKVTVESSPSLDFTNGKATPEKAGSYELTYTVTDKDGLKTEEYATLTVTKKVEDAVLYKDYDFTTEKLNDHGWIAKFGGASDATVALEKGAYVFHITNPGNSDGEVQLAKEGLTVKAANYRIKIWAKATQKTYCHLLAVDAEAEGWSTFGGEYNVVIDENIKPLTLNFEVHEEGTANILLNFGKITPNPDNAADTTPENFDIIIDKIEIYEITGAETQNAEYTCNFDNAENTVTADAGDGASANVSITDSAKVVIDSYPTSGGVWSIKVNIGIGDKAIEAGKKYFYSFDITAANDQGGECLVESATQYDKVRANFAGLFAKAGEKTTVSGVFVAENTVEDPVIRLQIGNASEGVTSNELVIDNVVFGTVTGDYSSEKTIEDFKSVEATAELPWATYNGTDEDNDLGVGTIYTENGSLFYRIDQGGITDWHNKLICGTGEFPLKLESDSYFTVEITAKATKNVSCVFFLNPRGSWDPRVAGNIELTTETKTFTFATTDTLITDMDFEMLFQFGSEATASLGEVTIEFVDVKIFKQNVAE